MRRRSRSDRGAVAILTAVLIPVLILLTALAVDLGRWYVEAARVQKAADAAALGGVTYMPNNYTSARTTAIDVSTDNGYPNTGNTSVATFETGVKSELGVTVESTIRNVFGSIFGNPTTTIARTAVADYQGPAIMGSPCNTFANEPKGVAGTGGQVGPNVSVSGSPSVCPTTPQFWGAIEGPETDKVEGDRFSTLRCGNSTTIDGCSGSTNLEYDEDGYFFVVRVGEAAINQQVTVQLYDPALIASKTSCEALPTQTRTVSNRARNNNVATITASSHGLAVGDTVVVSGVGGTGFNGTFVVTARTSTTFSYANAGSNVSSTSSSGTARVVFDGMNKYAPDAQDRYDQSETSGFCNGDDTARLYGGSSSVMKGFVTSFVLRNKTLTYDPLQASVISGCVKQYGSFYNDTFNGSSSTAASSLTGPSAGNLNETGPNYREQLAKYLHQWTNLCTFTPTEAGDYYLQVRTSAAANGSAEAGSNNLMWSGGSNAYSASATQTTGSGLNTFAIRAYVGAAGTQPNALNSQISVAGYQRMPIFQNATTGTATFNLLQVKPDAAGKDFYFSFFDVGDATGGSGGTVTVYRPIENTSMGQTALPGCESQVGLNGSITSISGNVCRTSISSSNNNGKVHTIIVPVPTSYTCDTESSYGCWFRVGVTFNGASSVTDVTTWTASIGGNALRLVQ